MNYTGWIMANYDDKKWLESFGIELGPYIEDSFTECIVSESALSSLDKYWGTTIYWGLEPLDAKPAQKEQHGKP